MALKTNLTAITNRTFRPQHLFKGKYNGPTIAVADDPLLRDVKLANKGGRSKLVKKFLAFQQPFLTTRLSCEILIHFPAFGPVNISNTPNFTYVKNNKVKILDFFD